MVIVSLREGMGALIDTIAAISTPLGAAGIGIVRISGQKSISIVDGLFRGKSLTSMMEAESYRAYYGHIIHPIAKTIIDEVICFVMREPKSFTKEDVVEIHCHGGSLAVNRILEVVLEKGARLADPGEFTKRAFLNGRIDLSQAEAVMDIINARTEEGMDLALRNLQGGLSNSVQEMRGEVVSLLAQMEALLDFPEDEVPGFRSQQLEERMDGLKGDIEDLLSTAHEGRVMREGIKTAIIGRPNVGKSSLLNAFVGERRAIVTDIPGTTRDSIEEIINIKGIPLVIVDTAGIRDTEDVIEGEGVLRSREHLKKSHLILFVLDIHEGIKEDDNRILESIDEQQVVIVLNKMDLAMNTTEEEIEFFCRDRERVRTSLITGEGVAELKEKIASLILGERGIKREEPVVNRTRHFAALKKALQSLDRAIETQSKGLPIDFVSIDLREVGDALGEITGDTLQEDIIDTIFAEFCLGK